MIYLSPSPIENIKHHHVDKGALAMIQKLGEPSMMSNGGVPHINVTQDDLVCEYDMWLEKQIRQKNQEVLNALNDIGEDCIEGDVVLVCSCGERQCHASVIRSVVQQAIRNIK